MSLKKHTHIHILLIKVDIDYSNTKLTFSPIVPIRNVMDNSQLTKCVRKSAFL